MSSFEDRYRIERLIGRGGSSEVFAGRQLSSGRPVAIKRVSAGLLASRPELESSLWLEAEACSEVQHASIPKLYDVGKTDDGDIYLVFEYLEGFDLETAFRKERIPPDSLVRIAVRVLDSLQAVHEAGWLHRDVKPSNVFLARTADGCLRIKLIDFGIAYPMCSMSLPSIEGTLEYMSPEQALGGHMDGRSDVWSVGALLYRGLVGWLPWPSSSMVLRARSLLVDKPLNPTHARSDIPSELGAVVERCLYVEPERRWRSAAGARNALQSLNEDGLLFLGPPRTRSFSVTGDMSVAAVAG